MGTDQIKVPMRAPANNRFPAGGLCGRRSVCFGLDSVVAHNRKALVESVC